ncbi:hypothetical protein F5Y08DRAFT_155590 [Xylaria arbuscula]|nr:hypothetical protein F5Y08DRAFT_155590 [Xylaria arbuscula]
MSTTIYPNCRNSLRRLLRSSIQQQSQSQSQSQSHHYSTVPSTLTRASKTPPSPALPTADIASLLSRPTWSVRSLLPQSASTSPSPSPPPSSSPSSSSSPGKPSPETSTSITSKTLHHLLRLSALPLPRDASEEAAMLATLNSQLHFVRAIQDIDTRGVAPLRAIRDETAAGLRGQTIGLAALREALEGEDIVGHARRPRRRRLGSPIEEEGEKGGQTHQSLLSEEENWDVLGGASETAGGRYFVVRSGGTGASPNESIG